MGRSTLVCLAAALAVLVSLGSSGATAAKQHRQGMTVRWAIDGVPREALVFGPRAQRGTAKHPLVLAFHGHGGSMRSTSELMHIQALWPQAIVVYPQGLNTPSAIDPAGTKTGWQSRPGQLGDRDLRLFDAIVATMNRTYGVDRRRVYATGFSNGAVFSLLLWAERAKTLAAIGEVAGRLDPAAALTAPRAVLAVAGRSDAVAPFALQRRTIRHARQANGAFGAGRPCGTYCMYYPSVRGPVPVKAYVHPGGHVYPGWASAAIVAFLQAHDRP